LEAGKNGGFQSFSVFTRGKGGGWKQGWERVGKPDVEDLVEFSRGTQGKNRIHRSLEKKETNFTDENFPWVER